MEVNILFAGFKFENLWHSSIPYFLLLQLAHEESYTFLYREISGVDREIWIQWFLVRICIRNADEIIDFSGQRFSIQALYIPLNAFLKRSMYEQFNKIPPNNLSCHLAVFFIGRDDWH